jgi:RHS repeat-associated protein
MQGPQTVNLAYDALGRRTRVTRSNGISMEHRYDASSRLTALIYENAQGVLGDLTYQYDRAGKRTGVGGSFARVLLPEPVPVADYDLANRQLLFGNNTMAYDASGNLATLTNSLGVTTFDWDVRNRLKGTAGLAGNSQFAYDVFGRRVSASTGGQFAQYLYDGINPIQESSTVVSANILAGLTVDEFFTRTDVQSATISHVLPDALGSAVALADSSGTIRTEYTYEPFGRGISSGASNTNPFQFTSREKDGSGLYYYRARYYHPELQRFISEDPIGLAAGDPNLFAYVYNNPTNFVDPSGEFVPVAAVAGALCATGAVAGAAAHHSLAGRKSTFVGFLAGAAAGCAAGVALGWGIGIALEAAVPSAMLAGGQATLWGGLGASGAQMAAIEATAIGGVTIHQTFTGSALRLIEAAGVSSSLTVPLWRALSTNFVSGAGSATALVGSRLAAESVLITKELPVLQALGVKTTYLLFP